MEPVSAQPAVENHPRCRTAPGAEEFVPTRSSSLSRLFLKERGRELLGSSPSSASSPPLDRHALAAVQVVKKDIVEAFRETLVKEADITLLIMGERAIVEIRSTDGHPPAVDHHRFVMQHRTVEF